MRFRLRVQSRSVQFPNTGPSRPKKEHSMLVLNARMRVARARGAQTLAAAVMLLLPVLVARAQTPDELFQDAPLPDEEVQRALEEPEVVRLRFVFANLDLIGGGDLLTGADALVLDLFDDVQLTAVKDRFERRSQTRYSWFGHLGDDRQTHIILVVRDNSMAGTIQLADKLYQVLALDDDSRHAIREIDQSAFVHEEPEEDPTGPFDKGAGISAVEKGVCSDEDFIDVMVVYTEAVDNSPGDILAEIQAAIDDSNQSYINSNITQRLRLVHAAEIDYAESGDAPTDRNRLKDPVDGFMDDVHSMRDTYGADIVSLWTKTSNYCGYAFIMSSVSTLFEDRAFNVVKLSCAVSNHSFAHELGHNMSARHDRFVDNNDNMPFTFNHAFVNTEDQWRTIMAYNDACVDQEVSCTRLQYWSNPDVIFDGDAMGIPDGESDAADNRETLNSTRTTVQAFRDTHAPLADAGADQDGECGKPVTLDGSASCDPDDDLLLYTWTGAFSEGGGTTFGVMPDVTFPKGVHLVSLVVSDGLIDSVADTTTVNAEDLTAPDITCPDDVNVGCDESTDPSDTGTASAVDLCDPDPDIDFADLQIPGDCPQEKTIERDWTATDADGNIGGCSQIISVLDNTPPAVSCEVAVENLWPPNHKLVDVGLSFTAEDDCDSEPLAIEVTVSSDESPDQAGGAGGPSHCPDAVVGDGHSVLLRAERSGAGDGRVYVITVDAIDACGNLGSCQVAVTVPKSQGANDAAVDSGQAFDATGCGEEHVFSDGFELGSARAWN